MPKIYRPTYRKRVDGMWITRKTAKWYAKIIVGGRRKAVPLTTDKRASEIMLADLLRNAAMGRAGAVDPFAAASRTPLSQHLADWQEHLRFIDAGEKHIADVGRIVEAYRAFARVVFPPAATADTVRKFLADRKAGGRSNRTVNWTHATLRAFFSWMVLEKRMAANPTDGIEKLNESIDVKRRRRPLVGDEPERLIAAADASEKTFKGLSGRQRGTLYVAAMATGFRAQELASLTADQLDLDANPPVIRIPASDTKNSAEAFQPIPEWAIDRLRTLPTAGVLFPGWWWDKAAKMIRMDLAVAKIPVEVGGRVVDFHSIRHTYVADLRHAGVELGDAMKLARHSDPKLTLAIYGQSDLDGLANAVNSVRLGHRLGHFSGTKVNEGEQMSAAGGGAALPYNAPEYAEILAFSANSKGEEMNTPGAARTRNLPLRSHETETPKTHRMTTFSKEIVSSARLCGNEDSLQKTRLFRGIPRVSWKTVERRVQRFAWTSTSTRRIGIKEECET